MDQTKPQKPIEDDLCFISIVFPVGGDVPPTVIMEKISEVLKPLPKVKTDFRLTTARDGNPNGG